MSPAGRRLESQVSGVREHLRRRAGIAVLLWLAGGVGLLLVVAWLAAGSDGWRPGSDVPALLDALSIVWILTGVGLFRSRAHDWFGEVRLAASMERASGLRPGVLRGTLELSRAIPRGVSGSLASRAVMGAVRDLDGRE